MWQSASTARKIQIYITPYSKGAERKSLSKFFGPLQIRKLTKTMVEDWAAERSKEIAARTYNYTGTGPGN